MRLMYAMVAIEDSDRVSRALWEAGYPAITEREVFDGCRGAVASEDTFSHDPVRQRIFVMAQGRGSPRSAIAIAEVITQAIAGESYRPASIVVEPLAKANALARMVRRHLKQLVGQRNTTVTAPPGLGYYRRVGHGW